MVDAPCPPARQAPHRGRDNRHPRPRERHQRQRDGRPEQRRRQRPPIPELRGEECEKQRREGGIQPQPLRVADQISAKDSHDSPHLPGHVQRRPRADQPRPVHAAIATARHRPGFIDHQLRVEEACDRVSLERRGDRDANRPVSRSQQHRGNHRRTNTAARAEDRDGRELRSARERSQRHHNWRETPEPRRFRQHTERHAERSNRDAKRQRVSRTGPVAALSR